MAMNRAVENQVQRSEQFEGKELVGGKESSIILPITIGLGVWSLTPIDLGGQHACHCISQPKPP
jgi:hypothetical protein